MHRHANFVASTDRSDFLSDDAGSVRWICFSVDEINWKYNKMIDINQVWAQAYSLYKTNFKYQLTREEIAENENYNLQFYIKGAEHEAILACFTRGTKEHHDRFITSTEAIDLIKKNTMFYDPKMTSVAVGKAFRLLNFKIDTKYQSDLRFSIKGYYVNFTDLIQAIPKPNTNDLPY